MKARAVAVIAAELERENSALGQTKEREEVTRLAYMTAKDATIVQLNRVMRLRFELDQALDNTRH